MMPVGAGLNLVLRRPLCNACRCGVLGGGNACLSEQHSPEP